MQKMTLRAIRTNYNLSAKEVANALRAFGGSSSVPISTRKFWVVILESLCKRNLYHYKYQGFKPNTNANGPQTGIVKINNN